MKSDGHYYLIGFMGVGKSVVGRSLAGELGREFADLDRLVEANANRSIAEIFAGDGPEEGESGFRRLETQALERCAGKDEPLVVATGGGTATVRENIEIMNQSGVTIWLNAPLELILNRIGTPDSSERPLFVSPQQAGVLLEARHQAYSEADLRCDVDSSETPEDVAKCIVRLVAQLRSSESSV